MKDRCWALLVKFYRSSNQIKIKMNNMSRIKSSPRGISAKLSKRIMTKPGQIWSWVRLKKTKCMRMKNVFYLRLKIPGTFKIKPEIMRWLTIGDRNRCIRSLKGRWFINSKTTLTGIDFREWVAPNSSSISESWCWDSWMTFRENTKVNLIGFSNSIKIQVTTTNSINWCSNPKSETSAKLQQW